MTRAGSLEKFASRLHPDVVADIRGWGRDRELAPLLAALEGHHRFERFLDRYAEALVARHLRAHGCRLRLEVPTPDGKTCDLEVAHAGATFYLHVKRVDTDRPLRKQLTISSRLRYLERLERPYVVSVRWHDGASDEDMRVLVKAATDFILHARVGDELAVRADDGREIGGVLIVAPWEGPHVSLAIGLPSGFIDEAPRMRRALQRAYRQFMPRSPNVILLCSSRHADHEDFRSALLGSHVERWDTFPRRGTRIAHGRAADGLWHANRYDESTAAGWFELAPAAAAIDVRVLCRETIPPAPALRETLAALFGEIPAADNGAGPPPGDAANAL